jgi:RNA polymerase sigma-70 factor (ECF subfamily)
VALLRLRFEGGSPLCVVMTTFFSVQSDTSAVSDLRAWSEEQLIAAVKTGRRAPFGERCERHMKQVSCVTRWIIRNREDAEDLAQECFLNAFVHLKDFDGRSQLILVALRVQTTGLTRLWELLSLRGFYEASSRRH